MPDSRASFTLVELLIVIALVAVMSTVTIIVLNPAELLKQSRDSRRVSELNSLHKAAAIFQTEVPSGSLGTANTVYVSLPDTTSTCANLGLPALPSGWSYACVTAANVRNIDGTGWVPINLTLISSRAPLSALPLDPVNTAAGGFYYTYVAGSWEFTALMEGKKHEAAINDSDPYPGVYSIGTHHVLTPGLRDQGLVAYWNFDAGTGTSATDSSGNGNAGTLTNGPLWQDSDSCQVGTSCLSFDGVDDYVAVTGSASMRPSPNFAAMAWIRTSAVDTSGSDVVSMGDSYALRLRTDRYATFSYNGSTWPGTDTLSAGVAPLDNTWHFFVGQKTDSRYEIYVDGALKAASAASGAISYTLGSNFFIGRHGNGQTTRDYNGFMDEVRIYNRALSAAEIAAIYDATK